MTMELSTKPFIMVLKKGENLFEGILRRVREWNLKTAALTGLGMVDEVLLAYYELDNKEYITQRFVGPYELISLTGNLSQVDGEPFLHIHGCLGNNDYQVVGGHFMDALVGASIEILVQPLDEMIRRYDKETGLKLLCPIK